MQTGNAYVKGSEVTRSAYLAYKQAVAAGRAGRQGVGPCQLTYGPLQEQADKAGGCWDPAANMRVGFAHLAGLIRSHGLHDGFRRYNGSGPAAVAYANDAMHRLGTWRGRLAGAPIASPSGAGTPATLKQGDVGPAVERLQIWLNASYPAYSKLDTKPQRYGPQTVAAIREFQRRSGVTGSDANGTIIGPRTWAALIAAGYRP